MNVLDIKNMRNPSLDLWIDATRSRIIKCIKIGKTIPGDDFFILESDLCLLRAEKRRRGLK